MNLNALDKERIAAAVKWAAENPARINNASEILNGNPNAYKVANSDSKNALEAIESSKANEGQAGAI